jgi:hypothetical protein
LYGSRGLDSFIERGSSVVDMKASVFFANHGDTEDTERENSTNLKFLRALRASVVEFV